MKRKNKPCRYRQGYLRIKGFTFILFGAAGRTRTGTELPPRDFKSLVSAISPQRRIRTKQRRREVDPCVFCRPYGIVILEAPPGIGPGNEGFAGLCLTAWLWCRIGAEDEIRTRDICLGKATLYHWATPARLQVKLYHRKFLFATEIRQFFIEIWRSVLFF